MAGPAELSLEQYARIRRALRGAPADRVASILAQQGVTATAWSAGKVYWAAELERDANGGDGELLLRFAAACEADAEALETAAPSNGAAPSAASTSPLRSSPIEASARAEPPVSSRPVDVPSHLLPSKGPKVSPWVVAPPPPPRPSAEAAPPSVPMSRAPADADAPPSIPMPPSFRAEWQPPPSSRGAAAPPPVRTFADDETSMSEVDEPSAPLPFDSTARPMLPPRALPALGSTDLRTGTIDFKKAALDMDKFAWIHAELTVHPEDGTAIRARYGMANDEDWEFAQSIWRERFKRDTATHKKWWERYQANCQWLRSRGPSP
ncbi:MAG: hypothetical protein U0414_29340 [Polyangiaceae bacterium]